MHSIGIPPGTTNHLQLHGAFDFHSAPRLQAILALKLYEAHPLLILDCADLDFIDSHGIALLDGHTVTDEVERGDAICPKLDLAKLPANANPATTRFDMLHRGINQDGR